MFVFHIVTRLITQPQLNSFCFAARNAARELDRSCDLGSIREEKILLVRALRIDAGIFNYFVYLPQQRVVRIHRALEQSKNSCRVISRRSVASPLPNLFPFVLFFIFLLLKFLSKGRNLFFRLL